jgi:hypothetical protein
VCSQCKGFSERFNFKTPREYLHLVQQMDELVTAGTFRLVNGTCTLKELLECRQWPDDVIIHDFQCSNCGQPCKLAADTYHGSGGTWEMPIAPRSIKIQ